jgi:prepilin-type N-terminal cleavage/methylation domain-containing protein
MLTTTKKPFNSPGFTIVELLIVIIVIAILATLVITAYNGVQEKAENTKTIAAVRSYVNAIDQYAVDNGEYPPFSSYPCLGEGYSNGCGTIVGDSLWSVGHAGNSNSFNDTLGPYFSGGKIPLPSTKAITTEDGAHQVVGAHYDNNGTSAFIKYYLEGNVDCGNPGIKATHTNGDDNTSLCQINFPRL